MQRVIANVRPRLQDEKSGRPPGRPLVSGGRGAVRFKLLTPSRQDRKPGACRIFL